MVTRTSRAEWQGDLRSGNGTMKLGSGAFEGGYSFGSRFESGRGTNPEELIAAAHAGCFSMALAHELAQAGHRPESVQATATVHLGRAGGGFAIQAIDLTCEARVPGLDDETFQSLAAGAKVNCPVSRALAAVPEIRLKARLL